MFANQCACYRMRAILIGNSIVRDIVDSSWETISLPGANWDDVQHYIMNHIRHFRNCLVYIHVGPVRFTRMHKTENRREIVLPHRPLFQTPLGLWYEIRNTLQSQNSIPVLCTIYPCDFKRINDHLANSISANGRRGRQICQDFYSEWEHRLRGMCVRENRMVTSFNESNSVMTPFLHKSVFLRRRGYHHFRGERFLRDGVHPTDSLSRTWRREIRHAHGINLAMRNV
jgi:hypothetical protein